jgi:hypothetical protein
MATLHVALQEGFLDDTVSIRAGDHEVLRREHVKTRVQTGYAGSGDVDVPDGPVELRVEVPSQRLASTVTVDTAEAPYLGVSIVGGAIRLRASREPFGYL